jgi:hypothetical protein
MAPVCARSISLSGIRATHRDEICDFHENQRFALDQLRRHFADLGRCVREWAERPNGDQREVRRLKTSKDLSCTST